jgi:hypothetical protein
MSTTKSLEVFVPASKAFPPITEGFHNPDLLPKFLTEEPPFQLPEPEPMDYSTLKRLDPPFVLTPGGYKLEPSTQKQLEDFNAAYLQSSGKTKCFRCCNTGVFKWVAKGTTAKVCACVRIGAFVKKGLDQGQELA